jgi:hypothetical protein
MAELTGGERRRYVHVGDKQRIGEMRRVGEGQHLRGVALIGDRRDEERRRRRRRMKRGEAAIL